MAGTITNITGIVNESEFSVIEFKTLQNLTHDSLGLWNSATPDNPIVVAEGGTALFRVVKLLQWGGYNAGNRSDPGDLPKSTIKVKADIEGREKAKYEIETLDTPGLAFGSREAFLSSVANGISSTMGALMDAHWLELAVETAKANKATQEIINADFRDLDTDDKRVKAFRQISRTKTRIARQLDAYNIGSKESDFGTILHADVFQDLLLAMPKGGDSATKVGVEMKNGFKQIAGLGTVRDHVFLDQNIPAGKTFSSDRDFDFTNIFGAIAHKESLFVATQGLVTTARINGAGNQEIITKFSFFKKAIRPELVNVFRTVAST